VVSYLLTLPIPALLDQLAEAVECGHALPLEARVAAAPPILMAALQAVELARASPMTPYHPALHRTGAALDHVSRDHQVQILAWMLARRGVSIEATTLVEGAIAMREDGAPTAGENEDPAAGGAPGDQAHTLGDNINTAVTSVHNAGAGLPAPIEAGDWLPPGDQPRRLYVGTEVHNAIALHYEAAHPGQDVAKNTVRISSILTSFRRLAAQKGLSVNPSALGGDELEKRPDILNIDKQHLYEIKPEAAQAQGAAKARMYIAILAKAGIPVSLGPMGEPGTVGRLPAPAGVVMFESPEPGVITYRYRHARIVPVPIPARAGSRARKWRWELRPIKLTREQQEALVTTTVGGAMLILLMALLAPIGI
jgi:hypothetical protein